MSPEITHMHLASSLRSAFIALAFLTGTACALAAEKSPAPAKGADNYPLKTCLVSDEALGADAVSYTHKEAGKPDRVVKFCCDGCIDDFKKEPAKFIKKLDDAAKAQPKKKS